MKPGRVITGAILVGAVGSIALLVNSCSIAPATVTAPPAIPGARFVGNKTCVDCHSGITRVFPTSAPAPRGTRSGSRADGRRTMPRPREPPRGGRRREGQVYQQPRERPGRLL